MATLAEALAPFKATPPATDGADATIADEQRERSAMYEAVGVHKVMLDQDDRTDDERASMNLPPVSVAKEALDRWRGTAAPAPDLMPISVTVPLTGAKAGTAMGSDSAATIEGNLVMEEDQPIVAGPKPKPAPPSPPPPPPPAA